MNQTLEAIEFIESSIMREFLTKEVSDGRLTFTEEQLCSLVWNSNGSFPEKQAFFLSFPENPAAIDMIKRYEAVQQYLQEFHKDEVLVLLVNDSFAGVYQLFSVLKQDVSELAEEFSEHERLEVLAYDSRGSKFRARIKIDKNLDILGFDFSPEVVKEEKLWDNPDTDRVIDLYIRLPHPFEEGDLVSLPGSLDTYKIVNCAQADPDTQSEEGENLSAADMTVLAAPYDEDVDEEEDYSMTSQFVRDYGVELPLLQIDFA